MKKYLKIFGLLLCFLINSGFTSGDWEKIENQYKSNLTSFKCTYELKNNESNPGFSKYVIAVDNAEGHNKGIYDGFGNNSLNPVIAEEGSNNGTYYYEGKIINYGNYNFNTFIEDYINNKKCSTRVYFCSSPGNGDNSIELKNRPYDSTYNRTCYDFISNDATEEDLHPNGCYYDGAKSCKQYTKNVGSKTVYIELGINESNRNYLVVSYDSKFSPSATSPDIGGQISASLSNGDTVIIMKDDNNKTFFDYNCTSDSCNYPNDIQLVYGCSGYNYFYYLFNSNSTYNNVEFGSKALEPTTEKCEKQVESGDGIPFNPAEEQDCTSLLGNPDEDYTPAFYLNKAFQIIKYAAIVVLIVMSVIDFVTATASNDQDAIQKATKKTLIRLVFCVIIFLLPYLIKFILKYLNDRAIDLCGIE